MLKITSLQDSENCLRIRLAGQLTKQYVSEIEYLLSQKPAGSSRVCLDLANVTFVDRAAMLFLCSAKARNIEIEDCPSYVSRWIDQEGLCNRSGSTRGSLARGEGRN
jgi:ABC-type transporter Mla MlaB component